MIEDPIPVYVGVAGLGVGIALGAMLAQWRISALHKVLRDKDVELAQRTAVEIEREHAIDMATDRLAAVFGELASRQFESHTATFLKLAHASLSKHNERAKGDLAAREVAIDNLVRPLRDALFRTEAQLQALDRSRVETHGNIAAQLQAMAAAQRALTSETRNLVTALRRPEVRGQWGEITLRRLVELAGMVEHCDFVTQQSVATESGLQRPDLIVRLPDERRLVVDVKTPLDAYLDATEAVDAAAQRAALERHAAIVAGRVRELASKAYWTQFDASPEFVILFIPGDQFLSAALTQRPNLLDDALRQNVILATPTSFVALLKAVAYGWQQVTFAENASEIRDLAVQLYERLATFSSHMNNLGKTLGDSVKAFNGGVGSLERMVLPAARRFTELGVQPRQRIGAVKPVEETPRETPAPSPARAAEPSIAAGAEDTAVRDAAVVSTAVGDATVAGTAVAGTAVVDAAVADAAVADTALAAPADVAAVAGAAANAAIAEAAVANSDPAIAGAAVGVEP